MPSDAPNFTGLTEVRATKTRLSALAGGRVYQGIQDDVSLERDANGDIRPYLVVLKSSPTASARDRGMGVGEEKQPHILVITVTAYAADGYTASELAAAAMGLLIGWAPGGANSTPYSTAPGGYNFTQLDSAKKPSRFEEGANYRCTINLAPTDTDSGDSTP